MSPNASRCSTTSAHGWLRAGGGGRAEPQGEPAAAEIVAAGRDQRADELRQLIVGGGGPGAIMVAVIPVAGPLDR